MSTEEILSSGKMLYIIILNTKLSAKKLDTASKDVWYTWNVNCQLYSYSYLSKDKSYFLKLGNKKEFLLINCTVKKLLTENQVFRYWDYFMQWR